ncbi:phosphotriesterase family protein [Jiangella muralis]|uniref:phosphotriesterase family protein n=1 Tax=Jiangella muralis TaxID=702383 RepID=UPI0012FCE4A3|nr:hypothetical protein [Jiangella muralis]
MTVDTVLGPIDPAELSHVQTHEHLLWSLATPTTPWAQLTAVADVDEITLQNRYWVRRHHPGIDLVQSDADLAIQELNAYRESGGGTIVDATCVGIGRDPLRLREISLRSGVQVVMGSGYYTHYYHPPWLREQSAERIADDLVAELTHGVGDTGIKPGIIGEIGMSWPAHPEELKVLDAALTAAAVTGRPVLIHPGRDRMAPFELMDLVDERGIDPARIVMCHVDRTLFDPADVLALARRGCYVEFDMFGREASYYPFADIDMPNDAGRLDLIAAACAAGFGDQLLLAQDVCHKTSLRHYGGEGYAHILDHVVPLMHRKLEDPAWVRALTTSNPARMLSPAGGRRTK